MEKSSPASASEGMATAYYAMALLGEAADPSIELSILPERVCGICGYLPLLLRGCCPCALAAVWLGGAQSEQLDASCI